MSNPLISVITVVLNGEEHLEETIKSVISQNYRNFEYIIIDGGSNDGTIEIIKKYKSRIKHYISEKDKGIYNAMNKGLKFVNNGSYVFFQNSGDKFAISDVLERISKVATSLATFSGRRRGRGVTVVPIRIFLVRAAMAASVIHGSAINRSFPA